MDVNVLKTFRKQDNNETCNARDGTQAAIHGCRFYVHLKRYPFQSGRAVITYSD